MGYRRAAIALLSIGLCVLTSRTGACRADTTQPADDWGKITDRGFIKPPFDMPAIVEPMFPDKDFTITDFGATAGDAPVTAAIEKSIVACSDAGGGRVVIPAGTWNTGPIHLRSNVNLYLSKDAVVSFSDKPEDYLPPVLIRWEGMDCYNYSPLIYARDCKNIAVTGPGKLVGNGKNWWPWAKDGKGKAAADKLYQMILNNTPVEQRIFGTPGLRPGFVEFINCQQVLMSDFTIVDGPFWTIHPIYCEDVTVRRLNIATNGVNTDGVNPDSCKNVLIEHTNFATGDDCVTLKSGLNEDGWRVNKPDENIIVQYCHMTAGHGGVSIGSEMSGGIRNVFIHDCAMEGTSNGIRIKSMRGRGSYVQDVTVQDVKMRDIKDEAIQVTTFYGSSTVVPSSQTPPLFMDFTFEHLTCDGARQSVSLTGLPEKRLGRITIEHCVFNTKKLMSEQDAGDLQVIDVKDTVVK
jgi:polygalacturonase